MPGRSSTCILPEMPATDRLKVHAIWDDEARVWVATSEDVPGLATEADDMEGLVEKLKGMIPELLDANGIAHGPLHAGCHIELHLKALPSSAF